MKADMKDNLRDLIKGIIAIVYVTLGIASLYLFINEGVRIALWNRSGGCGQKTGLPRTPKGAGSLYILRTKSTSHYRFMIMTEDRLVVRGKSRRKSTLCTGFFSFAIITGLL